MVVGCVSERAFRFIFASGHETFSCGRLQAGIGPVDIYLVGVTLYLTACFFAGHTSLKVWTGLTSRAIRLINERVFLAVELLQGQWLSGRAGIKVLFVIINELIVAKHRIPIAVFTLMADARGHALFMDIGIVIAGAVGFVGDDRLDDSLGIVLMFANHIGQDFFIIDVGRCGHRGCG